MKIALLGQGCRPGCCRGAKNWANARGKARRQPGRSSTRSIGSPAPETGNAAILPLHRAGAVKSSKNKGRFRREMGPICGFPVPHCGGNRPNNCSALRIWILR